ncbi:(R)-mandelonitrile lyase [Prauserella alba]|uniref:Cupin domain-containing protein n=1 Tax=Prauserella alba TaxID=176898 RepID=A0ABN1VBT5_9PSEU|nr:cupin domain-containing protein [Prauserella alba]MCP2179100.1 Cupin domain protein [Prauserella alba]
MTKTVRRTAPGIAAATLAGALLTGCASDENPTADGQRSGTPGASAASEEQGITVSRAGERERTTGDAETFTGDVEIVPLYEPNDASTGGAGRVTFQPGARTAWHSHPAGQRLIVTEGTGWIQQEGQDRITVSQGDVVWFEPGVKHWHGATAGEAMTHIAVQDTIDDSNAEWMEHVTDEQYLDQA